MSEKWNELVIIPIYKKSDEADCSNYRDISVNYIKNFIQRPTVRVNFICRGNYWGSSVWILMQRVNY